jgi:hypothetical protein
MSGLKQIRDQYSSDKSVALRSTEVQVKFIKDNLKYLARVDKKGSHRKFMDELPGEVTLLADWQRSRVEKIYELVFKGYDMPAVNEHVDRKRKGLNFGI